MHAAAADLVAEHHLRLVLTEGKAGAVAIHEEEQVRVAARPVSVVDTTGAGDAFVGAVLHQLANRMDSGAGMPDLDDWRGMIRRANRAGARTCAYLGAMEAFRHLNQDILA